MIDLERRRLLEEGKSPAEVTSTVKSFVEFYTLYLMKGMTPGQAIAQHPEWKSIWNDKPDGQYGRPAAFYQQLQALNLGEVWQNVKAPVLVIRGTADNIMSRSDAEAIVSNVNQKHDGLARYLQIEDLTHDMTVKGKFYDPLIPTVLDCDQKLSWRRSNAIERCRGRPHLYCRNSAGRPVNRSMRFAVGGCVENRFPKLIPPKNGWMMKRCAVDGVASSGCRRE